MILETQKILGMALIIFFVVPSIISHGEGKEGWPLCNHGPVINDETSVGGITAAKVARNAIGYHGMDNDFVLAQMEKLYGDNNELLCYIFTLEPQGYIVVPAHRCLPTAARGYVAYGTQTVRWHHGHPSHRTDDRRRLPGGAEIGARDRRRQRTGALPTSARVSSEREGTNDTGPGA